MSSDVKDFLDNSSGERHPAFKFAAIGDHISGVIAETPRVVETPNLNTQLPEKKLVLAVTTDDGQTFSVWVRAGFLARAVNDALNKAEVEGLEEGGRIGIRYSENRDTGKPQPAKVFEAEYRAPAPAKVGVDELL
jgi:hypothetical protein